MMALKHQQRWIDETKMSRKPLGQQKVYNILPSPVAILQQITSKALM
jgi:hypothetical protein